MRFSLIFVLGLAAAAHAWVSASLLRYNIDELTRLSEDVEEVGASLDLTSYVTRGSRVFDGVGEIASDAKKYTEAMATKRDLESRQKEFIDSLGDRREYTMVQQKAICSSYQELVKVQRRMVNMLISRKYVFLESPSSAGTFTLPSSKQMAGQFQLLESALDTFALSIIKTVSSCAQEATENKNTLDQALSSAVQIFRG